MDIIQYSRPVILVIGFLVYSLGAGIAKYLGAVVEWPIYLLGMLVLLPLLAASFLVSHYYLGPFGMHFSDDDFPKRQRYRTLLIQIISALLTISCASVIGLLFNKALNLYASISLGIVVLSLIALEISPVSLSKNGYGELVIVFVITSLFPIFSFLLQTNEFNRVPLLIVFPLTIHGIAWQIANNFSTYAQDQKNGKGNVVMLLTWQKAVDIHHVSLLGSILLFLISSYLGLSWSLIWPVLLAIPFILLQVYWLQRIANGGKPVWRFFNFLVHSTFGFVIYLLNISFWLG